MTNTAKQAHINDLQEKLYNHIVTNKVQDTRLIARMQGQLNRAQDQLLKLIKGTK